MTEIAKKKSKKKLFIFGGIGLLLLILILVVVLKGNKEEIIVVQTEKVEKRTITQTVVATGEINPEFKVVITPEVTGEIVSLPVKEGQKVMRGTVLLRIKADKYIAAKERDEANLQSAKASLSQRKAELDKITSDYNRVKELHAKKLSSDAELENAKSLYLSARAQYEASQAYVLQSEAAVKQSLEELNKTTILSPIDGTITQLNVELGERVLGSGFSQGTNIMTVSDLGNMEAIVDVDENDIVKVTLGDTTRIKVDAFGDRIFKGVVSEIGNSAKSTGIGTQDQVIKFEVKIKVLENEISLRPGMSCTATIETETKDNVLSVPLPSVTARGDNPQPTPEEQNNRGPISSTEVKKKKDEIQEIVFLIENGKAKKYNVTTGISDDNYIEVLSGLKGGEEVISGSYKAISRELNDGSLVRVENNSQPAKQPGK